MEKIKVKSEENILYANVLEKGMYFGLILMISTFFLYIFAVSKMIFASGCQACSSTIIMRMYCCPWQQCKPLNV